MDFKKWKWGMQNCSITKESISAKKVLMHAATIGFICLFLCWQNCNNVDDVQYYTFFFCVSSLENTRNCRGWNQAPLQATEVYLPFNENDISLRAEAICPERHTLVAELLIVPRLLCSLLTQLHHLTARVHTEHVVCDTTDSPCYNVSHPSSSEFHAVLYVIKKWP